MLIVKNLRCEYKVNPLGIDVIQPHLSWILEESKINLNAHFQIAYQILVASSKNNIHNNIGDLWDSPKIHSSQSNQIIYNGKNLKSRMECWWKVRVWDNDNNISDWSDANYWSIGLLLKSDWKAKWIGYNEWQKNYNQNCKYKFIERKDKWIWYPLKENGKSKFGDFYFRYKFKISINKKIKTAQILITADENFILYLNENKIGESNKFIFSWTRPQLYNIYDYLKENENIIAVQCSSSYVTIAGLICKLYIEYENGINEIISTNLNWKSSNKFFQDWFKLNFNDSNWKKANVVATIGDKPWRVPHYELILPPPSYLRKNFTLPPKSIRKATIYISAFGLYELHLNGKIISDDLFTPGWSNYNKRVYYNTYDITNFLNEGQENTVGVILADGWYSGYIGWERKRNYYGDKTLALIQIEIEFKNGDKEFIYSDESWQVAYGPIREADILMGETYDVRKKKNFSNWDKPFFRNSDWEQVEFANIPNIKIESYPSEPVKIIEEIKPIKIFEPKSKIYVFDLGQNFAGNVRIKVKGKRNDKIILRFAEMLNEDGTIYTENIRMARATDTLILKDNSEIIWHPKFTYHGFRYVELTGINYKPDSNTITGLVMHSSLQRTGFFECSNNLINKIYYNILWSNKSNYFDIPTDCPQRDERLGWMDAHNTMKAAIYNFDVTSFFIKWLEALNDSQREDGAYSPIAPFIDFGVGPIYFSAAGFAEAGIIIPYLLYKFYGDKSVLEKYYLNMKRYLDYLKSISNEFIRCDDAYGDWLSINAETPKDLIGTAYFAYATKLMSEITDVLGLYNDQFEYKNLFDKIKRAFNKKFVYKNGKLKCDTQTAYVLALYFELLSKENEKLAIRYLINNLKSRGWHVSTGFLGLTFLFSVLDKFNRNDITFKIITNETYPSYGFMIKNDATTLWERWNAFTPEDGFFDPTMNSFNHFSLGVVGEWFYSVIGGIKNDGIAFNNIIIKPYPLGDLTFANTSYTSIYGEIISNWKIEENKFTLYFKIPINIQAKIFLPFKHKPSKQKIKNLSENYSNVSFIKCENNFIILKVLSGKYEFQYDY